MYSGDMGMSFYWERPVNRLVGERLMLTMIMSFFTLLFVYATAIPIGIYSAVSPVQRHRLHLYNHRIHRIGYP